MRKYQMTTITIECTNKQIECRDMWYTRDGVGIGMCCRAAKPRPRDIHVESRVV